MDTSGLFNHRSLLCFIQHLRARGLLSYFLVRFILRITSQPALLDRFLFFVFSEDNKRLEVQNCLSLFVRKSRAIRQWATRCASRRWTVRQVFQMFSWDPVVRRLWYQGGTCWIIKNPIRHRSSESNACYSGASSADVISFQFHLSGCH